MHERRVAAALPAAMPAGALGVLVAAQREHAPRTRGVVGALRRRRGAAARGQPVGFAAHLLVEGTEGRVLPVQGRERSVIA